MIYKAPDYITKYSDTLSEIIALAKKDCFSPDHIQTVISKSVTFREFENNNITDIAFKSSESLYKDLFPEGKADIKDIPLFCNYYWIGEMYIREFLRKRVTFQTLFAYLPIDLMEKLYIAYHEMNFTSFDKYVDERFEETPLAIWLKKRNISCVKLSSETGIPIPTLRALKTGARDISKLQANYLEKIAVTLRISMKSLLTNITLKIEEPIYMKN